MEKIEEDAMKKLLILVLMAGIMMAADHNYFGPKIWLADTVIHSDSVWHTDLIDVGRYPYCGISIKTSNPEDSTDYEVYFKCMDYDTGSIYTPTDTLGAADNTIFVISDSASTWMKRSVLSPVSRYIVIYYDPQTDHGNQCKVWLRTFLWKQP